MPRQSEQLGLTQPHCAAAPGLASPLGSLGAAPRRGAEPQHVGWRASSSPEHPCPISTEMPVPQGQATLELGHPNQPMCTPRIHLLPGPRWVC